MSSISLLGWDTANVIGFNQINQIIFNGKTSPNLTVPFDYASDSGSFNQCTYEFWALTNGGDGPNLMLKARFAAGQFVVNQTTIPLAGKLFRFQVNLKFIGEDGPERVLKVDSTAGTVHVMSSDFDNDTSLSPEARFAIKGVFEEYLNQNIGNFGQVFHTALLKPADGAFPGVQPTDIGYAVSNGLTEKDGIFAVLATTEGRTSQNLDHQIDRRMLDNMPAGANAVFAIGQELLTRDFLLPGALAIFGSATSADFEAALDGTGIQNMNAVTWGNFTLDDGTKITPTIPPKGFQIFVAPEGDRIRLSFVGVTFSTPASMGGKIVTTMTFTEDVFLVYDATKGHLVPTTTDPANPTVSLTTGDLQVSVAPDTTAQAIEWVEIGIGAALTLMGLVAAGSAIVKTVSSAATVTQDAAEATVDATQMRIIYSQLPANPSPNFVPPAVAAAPEAASTIAAPTTATSAGLAPWKTGLLAALGIAGGFTGLGLGIAKALQDTTLVEFAQGNANGAPAFTTFTDACFSRSQWPKMQAWTPISVRLNGVLLIFGTLATPGTP